MGREAHCEITVRDTHGVTRSATGRALLESDALILRGEARCTIPRDAIVDAVDEGGTLVVRHAGGEARLQLGADAAAWAARLTAAPKSLLDKLGVAPHAHVAVIDLDDASFLAQLRARTSNVSVGAAGVGGSALVFLGVEHDDALSAIGSVAASLAPGAALWVVHPKGRHGVADTSIFAAAKAAGLTYTKVARFSDTHTAEKLVVPRAAR